SARLYKRIWRDDGSPLMYYTKRQTELLSESLQEAHPDIEVTFGMRYGSPSLESAIDRLIERGCTKILLFNQYPQYSGTTTASNYDVVFRHILKRRFVPTLRVVEPYYSHPLYVQALADTIHVAYNAAKVQPEFLVVSYHGMPAEYRTK